MLEIWQSYVKKMRVYEENIVYQKNTFLLNLGPFQKQPIPVEALLVYLGLFDFTNRSPRIDLPLLLMTTL